MFSAGKESAMAGGSCFCEKERYVPNTQGAMGRTGSSANIIKLLAFFSAWSTCTAQVWIREFECPNSPQISSLAADHSDNVYVCGNAFGTNLVQIGTNHLLPQPFFAKFNQNGDLQYAYNTPETRMVESVGSKVMLLESNTLFSVGKNGRMHRKAELLSTSATVQSISACGSHDLILAGEFNDFLAIGEQTLVSSVTNGRSFFAARLRNGKPLWISEVATSFIYDAAGTSSGGCYLLGGYGVVGTNEYNIPYLVRYVFCVQALDSAGRLSWTAEIPGNYMGSLRSIAADRDDRCFVTGSVRGQMEADGQTLSSIGGKTGFVYVFDKLGQPSFVWMKNASYGDFGAASQVGFDKRNNWYVGVDYLVPGQGGFQAGVFQNGSSDNRMTFGGSGYGFFQAMAISRRSKTLFLAGRFYGTPYWGSVTNAGAFIARYRIP